jgi:ankyrin repeat protein
MPMSIPAEALFNACSRGDAAAVSRLLPAGGTSLNLSGPRFQSAANKSTPLMVAATLGQTDIVRIILDLAPNTTVDVADERGDTAPIMAARLHHTDIVRLLAGHGANVNCVDPRGGTALFLAVLPNYADDRPHDPDLNGVRQVSTVRALLRFGAGKLPRTPAPPPATAQHFCIFETLLFPQMKNVSQLEVWNLHACGLREGERETLPRVK